MRNKSGSSCLLCDPDPCTCSNKKPKIKVPKKTVESTPVEKPRTSAASAMRMEAHRPPPPQEKSPRIHTSQTEDDAKMAEAVQVAHHLLGATFVSLEDHERYQAVLNEEPSARLRAFMWRLRNGRGL